MAAKVAAGRRVVDPARSWRSSLDRYVALLRGVNVGRAKRLTMADLRALLEGLGCTDVRTLLNSGNAVYSAPAGCAGRHGARIEAALARDLGLSCAVIVKSATEIEAALAGNALRAVATEPSRMLVAFTGDEAALSELAPLRKNDWTPELLQLGKHAAYVWCPRGVIDSKLLLAMDRLLGDRLTTRNWSTVGKIAALLRTPDGPRLAGSIN